MINEVQEALNEILDMAPMFRREFIIDYVRKNLPKDEAKKIFIEKDFKGYINRMKADGYALKTDVLENSGKERVMEFIGDIKNRS